MAAEEFLTRRIQRVSQSTLSPASLDEFGGIVASSFLPPFARLCAAGKVFAIDMSGGTAKAPVIAMPTTSPEWGLYNFSTSECCVPLRASINLASGTAGLGLSLCVATAIGPQTAVTADYTGTIKTALNGGSGSPDVYLDNNPTLIGGTPAWFAAEGTKVNTVGTDSVGDTITFDLGGLWIAKPNGHMVAFEAVGETGTSALFDFQVIVAMIDLDTY